MYGHLTKYVLGPTGGGVGRVIFRKMGAMQCRAAMREHTFGGTGKRKEGQDEGEPVEHSRSHSEHPISKLSMYRSGHFSNRYEFLNCV